MSDNAYIRIARTREQAHEAITQGYAVAKALLADGKRVRVSVSEDDEAVGIKQRKFLHGPVFGQISEQVRVEGQRYAMDVWKEFFRKEFLGDRYVLRRRLSWDKRLNRVVLAKRATPQRERISTEELGIKRYSAHIDRVIAHAVTEWGVAFVFDERERDEVRWRPAARNKEAIAA